MAGLDQGLNPALDQIRDPILTVGRLEQSVGQRGVTTVAIRAHAQIPTHASHLLPA